ncbi:MAG: hypothetical protein AAFX93_07665 [Verrucomicrobiota bacterium]
MLTLRSHRQGLHQNYLTLVDDSTFAAEFESLAQAERKLRWLRRNRDLGPAIVVKLSEKGYWPFETGKTRQQNQPTRAIEAAQNVG